MSPSARIVARIDGPPSEGLKVEQKVEQKSLGKFSRPFYTMRATPLGVPAYRVTVQKKKQSGFWRERGP
jgi:hypothetical protein